jgi:sterol desaturase/sphingolipid hydroxylase (fatty acid hydroxylase superfamily)
VAIQLLLQHSNVAYSVFGLDRWLAWNRPHRFHHLASASDGDVNFGLFTTLWDRALSTYHEEPQRRFTIGDLGVAGRPDYPTNYLDQLREPFRSATTSVR